MKRPVLFLGVSAALLGALLVAGVGCGEKAVAAEPVASSGAASDLPVLGQAAAWKLKDLAGREVSLSDYKGKVVVLDFWATWCAPCRKEMPDYIALQKRLGDRGLVVLGVSLDGQGPGVVKKFADSIGVNYPVVMGDDEVTDAYKVSVLPTTFVIDREGRIRHRKEGQAPDLAAYERQIESLL